MDLIYADKNGIELGTLKNFLFDLAYGVDENSFECTIDRSMHCCEEGYLLCVEDTEYGGIVDKIRVGTMKEEIVYSGRTFHGIIDGKIICPDAGQDYLVVNGEANQVLAFMVERLGLSDLFTVSTEDSEIEVVSYQFDRYISGYLGISKMLAAFDAKLKVSFAKGTVILEAVIAEDYSTNDELDSLKFNFDIEKNFRPVNHLVCLGSGELSERKVIHLFADENGGIQPYAKTDMPYSDSDYITDTSQQILFGKDEVAKTYELTNAAVTVNYLYLEEKPDDWQKNISSYFKLDDNESFVALESWEEDEYILQMTKPQDWDVNFGNYFYPNDGEYANVQSINEDVYTELFGKPSDWDNNYGGYYQLVNGQYESVAKANDEIYKLQKSIPSNWSKKYPNYYKNDNGRFVSVSPETKVKYTKQKSKPKNWKKEYSSYYYFYSDGISERYYTVPGISKTRYIVQTRQPTDWKSNYTDYFFRRPVYQYLYTRKRKEPNGIWSAVRFYDGNPYLEMETDTLIIILEREEIKKYDYISVSGAKAPKWTTDTYFTKENYQVAPTWESNKYYTKSEYETYPEWQPNTYYTLTINTIPTFFEGIFYQKSVDTIPTWGSGKYYTKAVKTMYPSFLPMTYFERRIDNFADLVRCGMDELYKYNCSDELNVTFDPEKTYDIGDIVGATENITGISVVQKIVKKIVHIMDNTITVDYEIGG